MGRPSREQHSRYPPDKYRGQNCHQFKGVRMRKWGSWGAEIRRPKTRAKIWLGSYKTAEQAARAYDAGVYCLRGPNAKFNFPDFVPSIPSAFSLCPRQIQVAAAKHARGEPPFTCLSPGTNNSNNGVSLVSSSQSSFVSETELYSNSEQTSEEQNFWMSLFDSSACPEFQNFPSIDDNPALDFIPTLQEEEKQDGYISLDLWNF